MKYSAILKVILAGLLMTSFAACEKTPEPIVETTDQVTIMLDVDKVSLESVNIRVRHEGAADMLWVYMLTSDLQTSAQQLLEEKIAELEAKLVEIATTPAATPIVDEFENISKKVSTGDKKLDKRIALAAALKQN